MMYRQVVNDTKADIFARKFGIRKLAKAVGVSDAHISLIISGHSRVSKPVYSRIVAVLAKTYPEYAANVPCIDITREILIATQLLEIEMQIRARSNGQLPDAVIPPDPVLEFLFSRREVLRGELEKQKTNDNS